MTVGVLLLAAGASRRFGSDKRGVLLADGRSLLRCSAERALASGLPLVVALRQGDASGLALLQGLPLGTVACQRASAGMGCSIADAVAQLPPWRSVLITPADMPAIAQSSFRALAAAASAARIVAPVYRGRRGHPVAFGRDFFGDLQGLQGDVGARELLRKHRDLLVEVAVADPGVLRDVDRPSDLD